MVMTNEHYYLIRDHFIDLLGGQCFLCGTYNKDNLHLHHKNGCHLINGLNHTGRGKYQRVWELFKSYKESNLRLVCKDCHLEADKLDKTR